MRIEILRKGERAIIPVEGQGCAFVSAIVVESGLVFYPDPAECSGFIVTEEKLNELGYFRKKKKGNK